MEQPLAWVDMEFDRSPSELIWVDSKQWGPLNGSLLSLSYGYGKVQLVLHEEVNDQMQGGVIDLAGVKFLTGVMRGRFSPKGGNLYACGMSAWGTTRMEKAGGLYRLRYTGKPVTIPLELNALETGIKMRFAVALNRELAGNVSNYEVKSWQLKRSSEYGSERNNVKVLEPARASLSEDGKSVMLELPDIEPVDVMTINYKLADVRGDSITGTLQNTIHHLRPAFNGDLEASNAGRP